MIEGAINADKMLLGYGGLPEKIKDDYKDSIKSYEIAVEAIKKQIPKKPIGDLDSCPHYRCSSCRCGIKLYADSKVYPFCHHCGQAIDWSEEEV